MPTIQCKECKSNVRFTPEKVCGLKGFNIRCECKQCWTGGNLNDAKQEANRIYAIQKGSV